MTQSNQQNQPEPNDKHTGYSLEQGLLQRVREWNDIFPWLRLGRTLRAAGSPVLVGLTALTFMLWRSVHLNWIARDETISNVPNASSLVSVPTESVQTFAEHLLLLIPQSLFHLSDDWKTNLVAVVWAIVAWTPCVLFLTRQGATLTAGREMIGVKPAMHRMIRIAPIGWLIAIVPLVCVALFAFGAMVLGSLAELVHAVPALHLPLALIVLVVSLPCGILGFGAYFAVPIAWAALANEQQADALDCLSRGYEYLYRRPLKVVLYGLLSICVMTVIAFLATGIYVVANASVTAFLNFAGAEHTGAAVGNMLGYYPLVMTITMFWSLVGGAYLLLRHDAGSQEIEDLWHPVPKPKPPLPKLDTQS